MFAFKSRALELVVAFAAFAATPVFAQGTASACPPYYDPASGPYVHTNFPTVWQPATLLANDSAGQAMWNKIAGSIPNIAPKGQVNGSAIGVTYDGVNDPDCCESRIFFIRWRWSRVAPWDRCLLHVARDMNEQRSV